MINQTITHYKITSKLGLRPEPKKFSSRGDRRDRGEKNYSCFTLCVLCDLPPSVAELLPALCTERATKGGRRTGCERQQTFG